MPETLPDGWRPYATAAIGTLAARSADGLQVVLRVHDRGDSMLYSVSLVGPHRAPTPDEIEAVVEGFFALRSPAPVVRSTAVTPYAMHLEQVVDTAAVRLASAQLRRDGLLAVGE